jgi:hypothetical protein
MKVNDHPGFAPSFLAMPAGIVISGGAVKQACTVISGDTDKRNRQKPWPLAVLVLHGHRRFRLYRASILYRLAENTSGSVRGSAPYSAARRSISSRRESL